MSRAVLYTVHIPVQKAEHTVYIYCICVCAVKFLLSRGIYVQQPTVAVRSLIKSTNYVDNLMVKFVLHIHHALYLCSMSADFTQPPF